MDILPPAAQPVAYISRQKAEAAPALPLPTVVASPASLPAGASIAAVSKENPTQNQVVQAIKQVNNAFVQRGINLYASFEKDKISGVAIVKILEKKSNEVIRQLPPMEVVAFAQTLELPEGWRGQWIRNMT